MASNAPQNQAGFDLIILNQAHHDGGTMMRSVPFLVLIASLVGTGCANVERGAASDGLPALTERAYDFAGRNPDGSYKSSETSPEFTRREFEHVTWQPVETTGCLGSAEVFSVRGVLETNIYQLMMPKTGPPMMQTRHVVSVSAQNGRPVGNITGRLFEAYGIVHFPKGDCLMLTDLVAYGTGYFERLDSFYIFRAGKIVKLFADKGDCNSGERRSDEVETDAAVRGHEILFRRRHTTFTDWWEDTVQYDRFPRRLVKNGSTVRIYCTMMEADMDESAGQIKDGGGSNDLNQ